MTSSRVHQRKLQSIINSKYTGSLVLKDSKERLTLSGSGEANARVDLDRNAQRRSDLEESIEQRELSSS